MTDDRYRWWMELDEQFLRQVRHRLRTWSNLQTLPPVIPPAKPPMIYHPLREPLDHVRLAVLVIILYALALLVVIVDALFSTEGELAIADELSEPRWDRYRTEGWSWLM
jgi:hypothetical protein